MTERDREDGREGGIKTSRRNFVRGGVAVGAGLLGAGALKLGSSGEGSLVERVIGVPAAEAATKGTGHGCRR